MFYAIYKMAAKCSILQCLLLNINVDCTDTMSLAKYYQGQSFPRQMRVLLPAEIVVNKVIKDFEKLRISTVPSVHLRKELRRKLTSISGSREMSMNLQARMK